LLDYALFLLGNPQVQAVSAATYDLLARAGFGSSPTSRKTGANGAKTFDVEDLAAVFMRLSGGGTLLVEASWAVHRRDGDEFGVTLYGTDGGAELIVDNYAPVGSLRIFADDDGTPVAKRLRARPGRGHAAVIEQFVATVRGGDWRGHDGAAAAALARVVDACYRSAAEQREVRLTSA
jgi:predicted dehydrogenase